MKISLHVKRFTKSEDGTLLVFFAVCIVAILGILALSFDMGRRASTQTDMQSFADNVALAAAGELDGSAVATTNATTAANNVIIAANETLRAGTAGQNVTITIDQIRFYEELPARDTPASFVATGVGSLEETKYQLPPSDLSDPMGADSARARFVGVRLNTTDVDWVFADMIFTAAATPDEAVGAVAVAGNSGWTCEISPLMFCLPMESDGVTPKTLNEGEAVQLRSVGRNAQWNPGEFGFLNIDQLIANDPNAAAGVCANENPESRRQACMLARGLSACFNSRNVDIQPGQRSGQETAGFNLPFGIFEATMNTFKNDPNYAVGPHTVGGRDINNSCRDTGPGSDTMAFPLDDCHYTSSCADGRFGDGDWSNGKTTYLDTNYSFTPPPSALNPAPLPVQGSFFDFPETGLTRYEFYLREIERAANGGVMSAAPAAPYNVPPYTVDDDGGRPGPLEPIADYQYWDDYWPDTLPASGFNPIIPDAQNRSENGLPQCNLTEGGGADRRVVIVAGIDCVNQTLTGNEPDVPVVQYYRTFMLSPATEISNDPSNGQMFDLWVEIIEPIGGEGGASTTTSTAFRELIQLYR